MKKQVFRIAVGVVIFIGLSNIVPLYHFFRFVGDGVFVEPLELNYITKDKTYVYAGGWLKDTLNDPYYKRYILMHPNRDRTLYRVNRIEFWRFWRWRDYLTEERWRQPYLNTDKKIVWKVFKEFETLYKPYTGSLPPKTYKDSVSVSDHFIKYR